MALLVIAAVEAKRMDNGKGSLLEKDRSAQEI